MTPNPVSAFFAPFNSLSLLFSSGLRRFVLVPLTINILIFSLTAWLAVAYFEEFIGWALPADSWLSYLRWLLWPLFVLAYAVITFYSFTIVANLIGAPFNGILAAKVEQKITGTLPPNSNQSIMAEILPALAGELGKLLYFALLAIPVLILMLIPGLNVAGSLLWLLLGFWFLAFEYADYPMGNHGLRPRAQRRKLREQPLSTWAFGAGVTLLMLIPVINFAAMPASVIGATRLWINNPGKQETF